MDKKPFKFDARAKSILLWTVLIIAFLVLTRTSQNLAQPAEISVGEMVSKIEAGDVTKAVIEGTRVEITTKSGVYVATADSSRPELVKMLMARKVLEEKVPSLLIMSLINFLPFLLIGGLVMWFLNKRAGTQGRDVSAFARSKSKLVEKVDTKFAQVAGADEAVAEVKSLVKFLKDPKSFGVLGGRVPKGILLAGPSGTGKTLLARAVAGEAGVPFIEGGASEFVEMFVGVGASRVRDLFVEGRKNAPCIIFIDEIDAVGQKRGGVSNGGHEERQQTLNQILVEMDGFADNSGVIVLAATNRPEVLDSALLRAGRFDRRVFMPLPDVKGREAILQVHAKGKRLGPDVNLHVIACGTPGMSGADLEALLNEAALSAAEAGKQAIAMEDIESAKDKVTMGAERKSAVITPGEKRLIAYHEAGHAVAHWFTPASDTVNLVSVIQRGMALGITQTLPSEDKRLYAKSELEIQLVSLLGGRAAEERLTGGDFTTGASNDLERVTGLARRMVTEFAMGDGLGPRTFGEKERGIVFENERRDYSEKTAEAIDEEVKRILERAKDQVKRLLDANWTRLVALAEALIVEENIRGERLAQLLGERPVVK